MITGVRFAYPVAGALEQGHAAFTKRQRFVVAVEFVQYQGRYLFSALTPVAFFLMAGLGALVPYRWRALPWAAFLLFLLYLDAVALLERLPGMMNY